jgi:hypothetical protein
MTYTVLLRLDPAGACSVIVRDDAEPLPGGDGVRYRLVAETDDQAEAVRVADLLRRPINAGDI